MHTKALSTSSVGRGSILNYAHTIAFAALQIILGLLLFFLIARGEGPSGFAVYVLARNIISLGQPIACMGLVIAAMRFLPGAGRSVDRLRVGIVVTLTAYSLTALTLVCLVPLLPGFPMGEWATLVRAIPTFSALCGVCYISVGSGILRGIGRPLAANMVMLLGLGVAPVASYLAVQSVNGLLLLQGAVGMLVGATIAVFPRARWTPDVEASVGKPPQSLWDIVHYGWRRVPGDASLPALFSLPVVAMAYFGTGAPGPLAGVGFTSSAALLGCASFALLTPVLLPQLSRSVDLGHADARTARTILRLQGICVGFAALACAIVIAFSEVIVETYLGADFGEAVVPLRIGILVTIPMAAFYAARPLLETRSNRSVSTRILLSSIVVQIAITLLCIEFANAETGALAGWLSGSVLAGALSVLVVVRWKF